jgi:hypothetical protein
MLCEDFVLGWQNIDGKPYAGQSFGYDSCTSALGTTNGAGPHNVQILALSADLTVLHALPGFWHPADLARELELALVVGRLWADGDRAPDEKVDMFRRLHEEAIARQSDLTTARSMMQDFDVAAERRRLADEEARDTFLVAEDGRIEPKPINILVHERMADRPFIPFEEFDLAGFVDYGRKFYDKNITVDGRGVPFRAALGGGGHRGR